MCKIAILLATYNGEKYILEQLQSLFAQTYNDFRIYIHDDGSEDKTKDIIYTIAEKHQNMVEILTYPSTGGAKNNFLSLLNRVDADYYMFCDQDDIWFPDKVEVSLNEMKRIEKQETSIPCLVFSDLKVVDENLSILSESYISYTHRDAKNLSVNKLLVQNVAAGCTVMINSGLAQIARNYKNVNNIFMHDWWFILLACSLGRIKYIDKPLLLYRQHGSNQVGAKRKCIKWIEEKIVNIFQGKQISLSMEGILQQRKMAIELNDKLPEDNKDKKLVRELSEIEKQKKIQRVMFYCKYNLLKRNIKNIWKIMLV